MDSRMRKLLEKENIEKIRQEIENNHMKRPLRAVADAMHEEVMNTIAESGMKPKKFSFVPHSLPCVSDCCEVIIGKKKKAAGFVYYSLKNGRKGSAYAQVFFKTSRNSKKPVSAVLLIRRRGNVFERYDRHFEKWIPVSADDEKTRKNILELEERVRKDRKENGDVKYEEAAELIDSLQS